METFVVERPRGSVTSWAGRTGAVEPQAGDYGVDDVGAEPVGAVATHAGDVSAHPFLVRASLLGAPGGVAQLGIDGRLVSSQHGGVTGFNGRSGDVTPQAGDYSASDVGADVVGSASAARQAHEADAYAHTQYLTRAMADAVYVSAGTPGQGEAAGMSWFSLSGQPRVVAHGEELAIAHNTSLNARLLPMVWMRQGAAQDVTHLAIDFDLDDSSLYQYEAPDTLILDGSVRLKPADPGAVLATNLDDSLTELYGTVLTHGGGSTWLSGMGLALNGSGYLTVPDAGNLSWSNASWCLELSCVVTSIPGGRIGLAAQSDGGGYRPKFFWWLLQSGNGVRLGVHTNGPGFPTYDVVTDEFALSLGGAHHFVLQRNGQHLEMFVDGIRRTWNGGAAQFLYGEYAWPDASQPLCLGAAYDSYPSFVHGLDGLLRRLRLRIGMNLYSDNYAVPTLPFLGPNYDTRPSGWWLQTSSALSLDLSMVEALDFIHVAVTEPIGTAVRFLLSFDAGMTWMADVGQGWVAVLPATAQAYGMSASQLTAASTSLDVTGYASLRVLVSLKTSQAGVTPSVDSITIQYDERASYSPAVLGRYDSQKAEFGVKHWSRVTRIKNLTGTTQTIIAYVVRQGS